MESEVFILSSDPYHSEDPGYDAFCWDKQKFLDLPSKMCMDNSYIEKSGFEIPQKLFFQANFDMIPFYDFPYVDLSLLIVSNNMLNILNSIQQISYRSMEICMIDFKYLELPFEKDGNLKSDVAFYDNYLAIQLLKHYDYFDYENSIYEYFLDEVSRVKKIVLKNMDKKFPPLFRLTAYQGPIFISKEAKEALEANEIKGCVFEPVEVTPYLQS